MLPKAWGHGQGRVSLNITFCYPSAMKILPLIALAGMLAGCASQQQGRLSGGATTPFSDFNLVPDEIPTMVGGRKKAFLPIPANMECAALIGEIAKLDVVLGPDVDVVSA